MEHLAVKKTSKLGTHTVQVSLIRHKLTNNIRLQDLFCLLHKYDTASIA